MAATDHRSTERILLAIPVRVLGLKTQSGEFMEDTRTAVVNGRAARIALKNPVAVGDTLRIINLHNYNKGDFRVVAPGGTSDQGVPEWGVECLGAGENIWGIEFSPPLKGKAVALIQCQACRAEGFTALAADELEVLSTGGSLTRPCARCHRPTNWGCSSIYHPPRELEFGQGIASPARPEPRPALVNRRSDDRHGVKQPVLIRGPRGQEEGGHSENISAGGFAVSLAMDLQVGERVQVVYPCLPDALRVERTAVVRRRATYHFGGWRLFGFQFEPA